MWKKLLTVCLLSVCLLIVSVCPAMAETDFTFDRSVLTLFEGETLQLTLLRQGGALADEPVTYTSSAPNIATVNEQGVVTALSKGKATINAAMKVGTRTYKGAITLTIQRAVTELTINEENLTVYAPNDTAVIDFLQPMEDSDAADWNVLVLTVGTARNLKVSALPKTASDRNVTVTVTDPDLVRVSGLTVTPRQAGECQMTIASKLNPEIALHYRVLILQPVKTIKVMADSKTVSVGGKLALTATVSPDSASMKGVTWTSANEAVATVDENGVVTGVKKGTANIRATAVDGSKHYGTIQITVQQQPTEINLSSQEITVAVGRYQTLTATVLPNNANNKGVTWSSSNENIAKVNTAGRITPVSAGECIITCTSKVDPMVTATARVVVTQPVTKIAFTEKSVEVNVGSSVQVYWTVSPSDVTDDSVTFSSNAEKIATVDANGVIHGWKRGTATITATATDGSKKRATIKVNVLQPVTGVHMRNDSVTVDVEEPTTLTAVLEPSDASNNNMTWTSSDTRILTVRGSKNRPTVTGHAWGDVTITGVTEDGGYSTTASVHVGNYDKALKINDLYLQDNAVKIVVRNVSNLNITRFYFRITLYDLYGEPLPCTTTGTNTFDGSYSANILYEGDSTTHGRFYFNSFDQPGEDIGKIEMVLTGYVTDTGYSRNIQTPNQVVVEYTSPNYIGKPEPTETPVPTEVPASIGG